MFYKNCICDGITGVVTISLAKRSKFIYVIILKIGMTVNIQTMLCELLWKLGGFSAHLCIYAQWAHMHRFASVRGFTKI